jgi:hypothetical protein
MMPSIPVVFAYFSPETFLPMTSIIASALGAVLLFGRSALRLARGIFRAVTLRQRRPDLIPRPHFRFAQETLESNRDLAPEDHASASAGPHEESDAG